MVYRLDYVYKLRSRRFDHHFPALQVFLVRLQTEVSSSYADLVAIRRQASLQSIRRKTGGACVWWGGGEGVLRGRTFDPWMAVIPEFTHSINNTIHIVSNTCIFLFILEANNKIIRL